MDEFQRNRNRLKKVPQDPAAPGLEPMQGMQQPAPDPMMNPAAAAAPAPEPAKAAGPIGEEQCLEWTRILNKYRAGKTRLERRLIEAERWWKLRNSYEEQTRIADGRMNAGSAWLHNVIVNQHSNMIEAFPRPNILPREEDDKVIAWALSEIIPCVLEHNHFEEVYSDCCLQKIKTGTGVYQVIWDANKNGIGDITISKVDLLSLYWEPGVEDIQQSKHVFHVEWWDKEDLAFQYPELDIDKLQTVFEPRKEPTDDVVSNDGKVLVVDVYYKKHGLLQYAKYVGSNLLYASENDPQIAQEGFYQHQEYPFILDKLFSVAGSPCGYGHIDINCNSQARIDMMNAALLKSCIASTTPRYFTRMDGGINEEEFLNVNNTIVHVANGTLAEDDIRRIDAPVVQAHTMGYYESTIQELRETAGNNDAATGSTPASVTSASGIAALQEASQRGSKAAISGTYRAYSKLINQVIELIRQFYDLPRQFRIVGRLGQQKFIEFSNKGMQPQPQGLVGSVDMGLRLPVYDIKIEPQKATRYTQVAQNELAKELFSMGMFNPENVDQALMVLDLMDFNGKEQLMQKIAQQGTMYQELIQYQMLALSLAQKYQPDIVPQLSSAITGKQAGPTTAAAMGGVGGNGTVGDANGDGATEHPFVEKARAQADNAGQPR